MNWLLNTWTRLVDAAGAVNLLMVALAAVAVIGLVRWVREARAGKSSTR